MICWLFIFQFLRIRDVVISGMAQKIGPKDQFPITVIPMSHKIRLLVFCLCSISGAELARAADWPHFLGLNLNLHSAETGLNLNFPEEGPKKLWEFPKGKGHAGPVVVDDLVVLMHLVGNDEVITCLDAKTGKSQWEVRYPIKIDQSYGITDMPRSSPVVDLETKTVYSLGNDSDLHAMELKTGKILWKMQLTEKFGEAPFFFGQGSCPLPYQDKLIVHGGAEGACVVALNKKTGEEIWRTNHQWNGSYASPIVTKINGVDRLFVFAGGKTKPPHGGLLCIDPTNGKVDDSFAWRSTNFASVNAASPVACGPNRIFITEDYGLGGVMLSYDSDFRSRVLWTSQDLGCQFQTPIYHDGFLYGIFGNGGLMIGVDASTGRPFWNEGFFKTTIPWQGRDIPISLGHGHMIHLQGTFLCLSENGSLLHLDLSPEGYRILSKGRLFYAPETWAPPVVSNGRLFINQNEMEQRLICFDLSQP